MQKVNDQRWQVAAQGLLRVCGITYHGPKAKSLNLLDFVVNAMTSLIAQMGVETDREVRARYLTRLGYLMNMIPAQAKYLSADEYERLLKPLEDSGLFWPFLNQFAILQLNGKQSNLPQFVQPATSIINDMLRQVTLQPEEVQSVNIFLSISHAHMNIFLRLRSQTTFLVVPHEIERAVGV